MKSFFKYLSKRGSANIYVTLIALGVVIVIFTLFIAGIKDVNVSYESKDWSSRDQSIKISETLINDYGKNDISDDWVQTDNLLLKKLGFKTGEPLYIRKYDNVTGNFTVKYLNAGSCPFLFYSTKKITVKDLDWGGATNTTSCFLSETKVLMGDGTYKNIENINIGEEVLSFDFENEKLVNRKVETIFHHKQVPVAYPRMEAVILGSQCFI